jgi:hypothetical protein
LDERLEIFTAWADVPAHEATGVRPRVESLVYRHVTEPAYTPAPRQFQIKKKSREKIDLFACDLRALTRRPVCDGFPCLGRAGFAGVLGVHAASVCLFLRHYALKIAGGARRSAICGFGWYRCLPDSDGFGVRPQRRYHARHLVMIHGGDPDTVILAPKLPNGNP